MGAWGEKAFQNDSALDWLAEFQVRGLVMLRDTLSRTAGLHVDDYLDVDDGASSIAAAEVVAAALGRQRDRVPEELSAWLDTHQDSLDGDDQVLARQAVERVLAAGSELRELWEEGTTESAWHADVGALLGRLGGNASSAESVRTKGIARILPKRATFEREKQTLVTFLQARGLRPTAQQMARIHASHDANEIRRWLARVVNAGSIAEMLDD
jgi:hypothetical protein